MRDYSIVQQFEKDGQTTTYYRSNIDPNDEQVVISDLIGQIDRKTRKRVFKKNEIKKVKIKEHIKTWQD